MNALGVLDLLVSCDGTVSLVDLFISSGCYVPNIGICCSSMFKFFAFINSATYGAVASRALKWLLAVIGVVPIFELVNPDSKVELKMLEPPVYPFLSIDLEVLTSTLRTISAA